jgi:hypothetical protein
MHDIEREMTEWLKCAQAEQIVLGHIAPSTVAALADCERRVLALIAAARQAHETAEEKQRRSAEEAEQRQREALNRKKSAPAPHALTEPDGAAEAPGEEDSFTKFVRLFKEKGPDLFKQAKPATELSYLRFHRKELPQANPYRRLLKKD